MKTKTIMVDGIERTVRVFPFKEYEGFDANDALIMDTMLDPDRRWLKRNGELHLYDDAEYAKADS